VRNRYIQAALSGKGGSEIERKERLLVSGIRRTIKCFQEERKILRERKKLI